MSATPRPKRKAPKLDSGINGLITACNKNDRFKLLDDTTISPGDLDNPIHSVFSKLDSVGPMKQMLQLASHFLTHDTLLSFFIPLLYGRELKGVVNGAYKSYLSNPLASASGEKYRLYLAGVRDALECLSHSVSFHFVPPVKRVYARTLKEDEPSIHSTECYSLFQRKYSCKIELADYFKSYYTGGEYAAASPCAQFRHDFLFATTLVHEVVHAIGVLRRGNLEEPYIRTDCPDTEWGYGWEHFMFGCVINPQDRSKPGTHLLMRKIWADPKAAEEAGGKEYSDVSMSYIAQWFRKDTWDIVRKQGPAVITAPITHFKIQSSNKLGAWVVKSDCSEIIDDLIELHEQWERRAITPGPVLGSPTTRNGRVQCTKILWQFMTPKQLQKHNVPMPVRAPQSIQSPLPCFQNHTKSQLAKCKHMHTALASDKNDTKLYKTLDSNCRPTRKRRADLMEECSQAKKVRKLETGS
ncbi:hypothetical protein COCC4DRAFT_22202 [Bipolaris maydis ATCC 48331]|uniref:Uncharacterized protein n=2 Tax=Cochliobolus heterostrophus TaxID=5016 RepID=M2UHL0_COCH5|nr:uncharacterized protein COCC4DRAFT_22202 [Bipolaris maydis ATCC 48331]EMD87478.1 hypothetical protein COCHEDRAFT_1159760 [Bipolaris maydis C5]KAH7554865.1 hypothetical protein BM1_07526 [Bipolaris maydis]ENI06677.1 hypothetical protein COCC4DRAFT_22202 [Bipolaris maydis ATCC 48331]KAJ5023241.1 hypothetical protein J3E73DRAFT_373550 [Bipolaris maydis]KAJ5035262.1 hypothetical protein J3E74DRAFT_232023 [Bipolaris maydis]